MDFLEIGKGNYSFSKTKKTMRKILFLILFAIFSISAMAQLTTIEGYVFESDNRGYLNLVDIKIFEKKSNQAIIHTSTDKSGFFTAQIPAGKEYRIEASKDIFYPEQTIISTKLKKQNQKVFAKIKMKRKPGYLFDVTLAEVMTPDKEEVNAITNTRIEVYNNTTKEIILDLPYHPSPTFQVNFERGNHYTVMIRKEGYFTKRVEANVDIKGCILCFEGVGDVKPGVSDVLTEGNRMGTLLANIEMRPIVINQAFELRNIYYDLDKASLRPEAKKELDKLAITLKNNPDLIIEIGAHTDSRGPDSYNLQLSQERAEAVVNYLVRTANILSNRLIAKGYGETQLLNGCTNEVVCSEALHQQNRRTELKVINQIRDDLQQNKSLKDIIELENLNQTLAELDAYGTIEVKEGEALPEEIARDIQGYQTNTASNGVDNSTINDPHTEVTNSARLAAENYEEGADRESMKRMPMPTSHPVKNVEEMVYPNPFDRYPNDKPSAYEEAAANRMFASAKAGETVVSLSKKKANTKYIPINYTGYKAEFMTSPVELEASHKIFTQHGNIFLERKGDGTFGYLLGDYSYIKDAELFLTEVIRPRYPFAFLVRYLDGQRVKVKNIPFAKRASAPPR